MKKSIIIPFILVIGVALVELSGCSDKGSSPTPDTTAPTVSSTTPSSGAIGVATNAVVSATFSEAMDPGTITAATFTLKNSKGNAVSGTVACAGANATFTPSAALDTLGSYTATITTGAKDLAGNALAAAKSWSFTIDTTPSPLISAATLKMWMDNGLVNGTGNPRVLVLDVSGSSTYNAAHIPGAQMLDPSAAVTTIPLYQNRQEGPAVDVNMVPDGSHMDALVQHYGIDDHTTIVFSAPASNVLQATRAYWTFRYWGFPKDMLKVLDGFNVTWDATYALTTTPPPALTSSSYSVKSNASLRDDLRATLSEMMSVAKGDVAGFILDGRSGESAASYDGTPGKTPGVFGAADFVVFEGHMKGARALAYTSMYDSTTLQFKSKTDLTTLLQGVNIDGSKPTYVHCRTGVIASVPFFVLDAILDWPVVNYDGSWSQWGQMSGDFGNGGRLTADSPWRTDNSTYSDVFVYNYANAKDVELLALNGADCSGTLHAADGSITESGPNCPAVDPDSAVTTANQIEDADRLYMGH